MNDISGTNGLDANKVKNFYYSKMVSCLSGGVNKDYITNSKSTGFSNWTPNNVRYIYLSPTRVEVVCYIKNELVSSPVLESEIRTSQAAFGNAYSKSPLNALVAGRVFSNLEAIFLDTSSGVAPQWYLGTFLNELGVTGEANRTAQDKYPMFRGVFMVNPMVFKHATDVFKTPKGIPHSEQDVSEIYNFLLNRGIVKKLVFWNRVVKTYSLRPKWYDLDAPGGRLYNILSCLVDTGSTGKDSGTKRDTDDKDTRVRVKANQNEKLLGGLLSLYIETMKLCAIARRSGRATKEMEPYLAEIYSSAEDSLKHVSGVFYSEVKPYVVNVLGVGQKRFDLLTRVGFCVQSIGDPNWDYRGSSKFVECMDRVMVNLYNGLFDVNRGTLGYLLKAYPDLNMHFEAETMADRLESICRIFKVFCNRLYKNARLTSETDVILFEGKEPKFEQISAREVASKSATISALCGDYVVSLFQLLSNLSYFSKISVSYPEGVMENLLNTVASEVEVTRVGREFISFYNTEYTPSLSSREKHMRIMFRKYDAKILIDSVFGNQKDTKLEDTLEVLSGYSDDLVLEKFQTLNTLINNALFVGLNYLFSHATKDFVPDYSSKEPYEEFLHYKLVKKLGFQYEGTLSNRFDEHIIETVNRLPRKFISLQEKALVFCALGVTGSSLEDWMSLFGKSNKPNIDIFYSAYLTERYEKGCNLRDIEITDVKSKMVEEVDKIPSKYKEAMTKLVAGYILACRVCLADNLIVNVTKKDGKIEKIADDIAFVDKWINKLSSFGLCTSVGEEVNWGRSLSKEGFKYYVGKADIMRLVQCGFIKEGTYPLSMESIESLEDKLITLLSEFRRDFLNVSSGMLDTFLNTKFYGSALKLRESKGVSPTLKNLKVEWTEKVANGFSTSVILDSMESEESKAKSVKVGAFLDNSVVLLKYTKYLYQLMSDKYVKGIFPEVTDKARVSDIKEIQSMASSIPDGSKFSMSDLNKAKSKMDSPRNGVGLLVSTGFIKKEGTATDENEAIKDTGATILNFIDKSLVVIETSLKVYTAFSSAKGGLKSVGSLIVQLKGTDIAKMSRVDMAKMLAPSLNELYSIFYTGSKDISSAAWFDRLLK